MWTSVRRAKRDAKTTSGSAVLLKKVDERTIMTMIKSHFEIYNVIMVTENLLETLELLK